MGERGDDSCGAGDEGTLGELIRGDMTRGDRPRGDSPSRRRPKGFMMPAARAILPKPLTHDLGGGLARPSETLDALTISALSP